MTRVLISQFETIVGIGVQAILSEGGCTVLEVATDVPEAVAELRPDALVTDLDDAAAAVTAIALAHEYDDLAVVLCSSDRPEMRVFPRGRRSVVEDLPAQPEALVRAVSLP